MSTEPEYRYERKFFIENMSYAQLMQVIKMHPSMFREIYNGRYINNIYFDSPDLKNYHDNEAGIMHRTKYRIRWYGELLGAILKPVLELKIKNGLMGTKEHYPLNDFMLDTSFDEKVIQSMTEGLEMPDHIKHTFLGSEPVIMNRYFRKYFISSNGKFRVTVDSDLYACKVGKRHNSFKNSVVDKEHFIVEVKYAHEDEPLAERLTAAFPFRMTKSSKYASAIEKLYAY